MTTKVIAEVVLRSASGASILQDEGVITSDNISKYQAAPETIDNASEALTKLGFEVPQRSSISLTVSGDKELFERTFKTRLQETTQETVVSGFRDESKNYFEAAEPLQIPEELADLIEGVAFSMQHIFP